MADYQSKYTGNQVEALLDIVSQGGGEGGEVQKTTEAEITAMGFTKNQGTITEVKMNGVSKGTEGVVDLGTVLTEHQDISGKQDKIEDLDTIRAGAAAGATALQEEQYKGTVTGVTFYGTKYDADSSGIVQMGYPDIGAVRSITFNGSTQTPTEGNVDLGNLSHKADLNNGKILASQLPDYILGQVMYGGIISRGDDNSIVVQPSVNYQAKYNVESGDITIIKYQFYGQQGVYFISNVDGNLLGVEVKKGDWLISTGSGVAKVDNTDAVSSVAGLTGVIDASALGKELSYNDLKDKPTIPSAVTESTVSGWGFTKNTGTYSKPSGGIPKTDLASAVQTSLGKADSAVQPNDISEFVTREDLAGVASSGSYNDLGDKPFIPNADNVRIWGFAKGVKVNGAVKTPSVADGIVDLGTIEGGSADGSFVEKIEVGNLVAAQAEALLDRAGHTYVLPSSANGDEDDILVSEGILKTINGQSLLGSGDITISGGGSSSGKEYVAAPLMIEPMGTSIMFTGSVPLEPNKVYVAKEKVSAISASISIPSDSMGAEYTIMFQTSTSEFSISVSAASLLWANGTIPTIEADTYYELSLVLNIINNTKILKAVLTPFKPV